MPLCILRRLCMPSFPNTWGCQWRRREVGRQVNEGSDREFKGCPIRKCPGDNTSTPSSSNGIGGKGLLLRQVSEPYSYPQRSAWQGPQYVSGEIWNTKQQPPKFLQTVDPAYVDWGEKFRYLLLSLLEFEKLRKLLQFSCSTPKISAVVTPDQARNTPSGDETSQVGNKFISAQVWHQFQVHSLNWVKPKKKQWVKQIHTHASWPQ